MCETRMFAIDMHGSLTTAVVYKGYLEWLDNKQDIPATFFTLKEIQAMRTASTPREKCAYYWFMENFIDCVVGKVQCRKSKYLATVSNSIITISDEAFALLLFENYEEKWHAQHQHRRNRKQLTDKMPRMHGKYTCKTVGQAEFGGWSKAGVAKFSFYCRQIEADRNSEAGKIAEQELLTILQATPQGQAVMQKNMRQQARCAMEDADVELVDAWNEM
jgi:hypothetical protein